MALIRTGVGVSSLLMPSFAMGFCGLTGPFSLNTVLMARLFGARETVLAFALVWALRNESPKALSTETRRNTRSVVLAGLLVDMVDSLSVFVGTVAYCGGLSPRAIGLIGGGAVLFSAIGAIGLATHTD